MIVEKKFLFGGRILAGRGINDVKRSLSNCYVISPPTDSIESIFECGSKLARTFSYGGGCIEENTKIIVKDKGRIPIKNVRVGDLVLSFNINSGKDEWRKVLDWHYTNVALEDQVELQYSNGVRLKTSNIHPILNFTKNGYEYRNSSELNNLLHINKVPNLHNFSYVANPEVDNICWFIGCHMGDGTADFRKAPRLRINGDNYNVINRYASIVSSVNNSTINVRREKSPKYKSVVWQTSSTHRNNAVIFTNYLDNQINNKCKTWKVPNYVKNNNGWVPFLAGLVDSDGFITDDGNIDISICSKEAIEEIASYLSSIGQRYHTYTKVPSRKNESIIYRLYIHKSSEIHQCIKEYVVHEQKYAAMDSFEKCSSKLIALSDKELEYLNRYNYKPFYKKDTKVYYSLKTRLHQINQQSGVGLGTLQFLYKHGIYDYRKYSEIASRICCKNIVVDNKTKYNYIDITVEGNENYYAGEFGFVCIHNCGIDISNLRPNGAIVNNAAKTTSGAVSFMDFFSYITGLIGQAGRRGALMISISCEHPDIEEFINIKKDLDKVTKANISIRMTDKFMQAAKDHKNVTLSFTTAVGEKIEKVVNAYDILMQIAKSNWEMGEPGMLFWDRISNWNLLSNNPEFEYAGVNP